MNIIRHGLKLVTLTVLALSIVVTALPRSASAVTGSDFNAARIIDDSIFFNPATMGPNEIQAFLNAKVPNCRQGYTCLKDYVQQGIGGIPADTYCAAVPGGTLSAAQIIFNVSQACGVNPQAMIVLLQKEQALVADTWPTAYQYEYATGFCVPDGPPPPSCAGTYGFANQVYYGARQFKKYVQQPQSFSFAAGRTSFINYSPTASCGGSNVTIHNAATAALYNYTPYQPNPGALANLYGEAPCGAYGNRNFWRMFNDWFGPTTGSDYVVAMADNGDTRQWVVQGGRKLPIPSPEIVRAYGLSGPTVYPGAYLGSIPDGPVLTRLIRPAGALSVYFVDGGRKYRLQNEEMIRAWNLSGMAINDVVTSLARLPVDRGDMSYALRAQDGRVFLMDGGGLRHIQNSQTLEAWEGVGTPVTDISDEYRNTLFVDTPLSSPRIRDNAGNQYIVSNRAKYSLNSATAAMYPWTPQNVSIPTTQRLVNRTATPFIRGEDEVRVHLVDQGQKHHVVDPDILNSWQVGGGVSVLSRGVLSLMSAGVAIDDYYAANTGTQYLIDGSKRALGSSSAAAYTANRRVYAASNALMSFYNSGSPLNTRLVKAAGQPQVYLLASSGTLRHITSPDKLTLWGGSQSLTELSAANLSRYTKSGTIGAYISDGSSEYIMISGKKFLVNAAAKLNWRLNNPDTLNDGTLGAFESGGQLPNAVQSSGQYFKVHEGSSYGTIDRNIADIWLISSAPGLDITVLREFLSPQMLSKFVLSSVSGDSRLFVVDNGILYRLSPEHASNLGAARPYMSANPETISAQPISLWGGILVKNPDGAYFVIDEGGKRYFANSIISDQWRYSVSSVPTVSNGFINALPTKGPVERVIKGSGPEVYLVDSITKRWIRSSDSYNRLYAPYGTVSDALLRVLPRGADIH